jgi:hypothetical protein
MHTGQPFVCVCVCVSHKPPGKGEGWLKGKKKVSSVVLLNGQQGPLSSPFPGKQRLVRTRGDAGRRGGRRRCARSSAAPGGAPGGGGRGLGGGSSRCPLTGLQGSGKAVAAKSALDSRLLHLALRFRLVMADPVQAGSPSLSWRSPAAPLFSVPHLQPRRVTKASSLLSAADLHTNCV